MTVTTFVLKFLIGICCVLWPTSRRICVRWTPTARGYRPSLGAAGSGLRQRVHRPSVALPQRVHLGQQYNQWSGSVQRSRAHPGHSIVAICAAAFTWRCALPGGANLLPKHKLERSAPVAKQQIFRSF